jgi:Ni/Co efflux regulator RcnB
MNRLVIAVFAAMVFSVPAMAQQPARKVGEPDQRCQVDRDRDRHRHRDRDRYSDRRADGVRRTGVAKSGEPDPCALKPHATRAGDPNPYATRAGDPNPYATKAGAPNPYATRAGDPNPYATRAGTPNR